MGKHWCFNTRPVLCWALNVTFEILPTSSAEILKKLHLYNKAILDLINGQIYDPET